MRIGNRTVALKWYCFNDLKQPLTHISRSRHCLTLNMSETIRDTDIKINRQTSEEIHATNKPHLVLI